MFISNRKEIDEISKTISRLFYFLIFEIEFKMNSVKKIFRRMPETNSSSSHSLVIDMNGSEVDKVPEELLLDANIYFGQDTAIYSDVLKKVEYAVAQIPRYQIDEEYLKYISRLKRVLLEKYEGVRFKFLDGWFESLLKKSDDNFLYEYLPSVDYQSSDRWKEIWESDETLKAFLFNSGSTLFIDSDAGDGILELSGMNLSECDMYLSYTLPPIGEVHIPIPSISSINYIVREMYDIFSSIVYEGGEFKSRYHNMSKGLTFSTNFYCSYKSDYFVATWKNNFENKKISVRPILVTEEFGRVCI